LQDHSRPSTRPWPRLFRPLFEQARRTGELRADVSDDELVDWIRTGELRADVSDDELVDWIRTVYPSLILRSDLDGDAIRRVVRTFLVPSMTCSPPPSPPRPSPRRAAKNR
jgi:hypothetical protein